MTTSTIIRTRSYAAALVQRAQAAHARLASREAIWALGVIAVLNVLLYGWGFAWAFPLLAWQDRPLLDLYKLARLGQAAHLSLIAVYLALGILYWLGWRVAQRAQGRAAWFTVLASALASGALLLWMYPIGAADLFDNIMHGRVLGVYWHNPFVTPPAHFPDDPFLRYVAWKRSPSAYGPGWEIMAALVAYAVRDQGVVANVTAFKLLAALFLAAGVAVVAGILQRWAPERALAGVVLLAWNPVILVETIGNGHNDMAMIVWVLAATWAIAARRFSWAVLLLIGGALVKYIPLLMLPAAGLIALRDLPTWPQRLRFLVRTGLASALLVALAYSPFWYGMATFTIDRRMKLFTTSLPAVAHALLTEWGATSAVGPTVAQGAALLTVVVALWQGVQAWRDRSWLSFPFAACNILFFYLLCTCLWFQSWYAVWPLGLAAILPPGHAARLAALFGYVALTKQLIFEPLWLWSRPLPPKPWRELRLGPAVLAIPWLYLLGLQWVRRWKE
jgi:hypothetical protein